MATAKEEIKAPKDIAFDSMVVDICCHPSQNAIAAGDMDGKVSLYTYSTTEKNHLLMSLNHHKKSCRCVRFSPNGSKLITAAKDKSIQVVDMEKGSVSHKLRKAHDSPVYSLLVADENIVASGDDDGNLKVWDLRQQKSVMDVTESSEFISDMILDANKRYLLATSGEGTLTCYDIRKHKMKVQSELFDSELLSLATVKNGEKVVAGTGEGVINIFNWGEWGNISDRFPGHPMSIDCMAALSDNILLTGSFDGKVRAVSILPNRFIGVVGEHDEFPVENLALSHCKKYLASCSHDQCIKFWNVENTANTVVDTSKKVHKSSKNKALNSAGKEDFFADLAVSENKEHKGDSDDSDDNDDSDDDDADEEEGEGDGDEEEKDDGSDNSDSDPPEKKAKLDKSLEKDNTSDDSDDAVARSGSESDNTDAEG